MFHGSVSRCEGFQVAHIQSEVGSWPNFRWRFGQSPYALFNPLEIGQKLKYDRLRCYCSTEWQNGAYMENLKFLSVFFGQKVTCRF